MADIQEQVVCVVCGVDGDELVDLPCKHRLCDDCMRDNADAAIDTRRFPVQCAACDMQIPMDILASRLPAFDLSRLDTMMLQAVLDKDPQIRYCPSSDCGYAVLLGKNMERCPYIRCDKCSTTFCARCKHLAHGTEPCTLDELPPNTKPCPSCFAPIEKDQNGTCNHMKCYVCKSDFCWLCLQPLEATGTLSHFVGLTGCTFYGQQSWSQRKRRLIRCLSPIWFPFAAGLGAAALPVVILLMPIVAVQDDGRAQTEHASSRTLRICRSFRKGLSYFLCGIPVFGTFYAYVVVRGAVFAYIQVPSRELRRLCGKRMQRSIDLTPHGAYADCTDS
eukprot:gene6242-271_t